MKKQWEQPRLIILVRSQPEEAILSSCKGTELRGDPWNDVGNCHEYTGTCLACDNLVTS